MSNENSKAEQTIYFPDLSHLLYQGVGNLKNVQRLHMEETMAEANKLRGKNFVPNYLDTYRTKLDTYYRLYNYEVLSELDPEIIDCKRFLATLEIPSTIFARLKNYKAYLEKVRSFIYDGLDPFLISDEIGFRIVVGTHRYDDENSIKQLYGVANNVISFFVIKKGYQLIKPSPAKGLGFNKKTYPKVFVPKQSLLYPEYMKYAKDYFIKPKKNGYQDLHLVFVTKSGLKIEVQFRTFASHYHAEFIARHILHKGNRYGITNEQNESDIFDDDVIEKLTPEQIEARKRRRAAIEVVFDPEKVKLDSYYSKNGDTLDLIGLQETIRDPFGNFYIA